jgi:hypothetical protein
MIDKPPETPGQLATDPPTCHVVVPYDRCQLNEPTADAVMAWGGSYTFEPVDPSETYAYPDAWATWWATGLDLVVVGQQAEVGEGIIRTLLACPRPWCVRARPVERLGPRWDYRIMKVSAQLTAAHPKLIEQMLEFHTERGFTWDWYEWDEQVAYLLGALGHLLHVHYPPAPAPADPGSVVGRD